MFKELDTRIIVLNIVSYTHIDYMKRVKIIKMLILAFTFWYGTFHITQNFTGLERKYKRLF